MPDRPQASIGATIEPDPPPPEEREPVAGPNYRPVAVIGLALVALTLAAGWVTGEATGAMWPSLLDDPGALVRWGLVGAQVISDLAGALTIGLLILAAVALPVRGGPGRKQLAHRPALVATAVSAAIWALSTLALLVFNTADISGQPLSDPQFGSQLVTLVTSVDLGRGLAISTAIAAAVALLAAGSSRLGSAGLLALLSLVALVPPSLQGHASGANNHETAVTGLGLHLLGISVWVGGLAALVLLRGLSRSGAGGLQPDQFGRAAGRFSTLALWCFVAVAFSGVLSAWIRLGSWSGLSTRYGAVIIAKSALLIVLGFFGWRHREGTLPAITAGRPRAFLRLAVVELGVMALALGLGVALSRTAPPVQHSIPTNPAESLTGYPLPPAPAAGRWLTQWQPDLMWVIIAGLMIVGYVAGVVRLHRRGDRWPVLRTISWMVGSVLLLYVTSGPPMAYGRVLFSAHMVDHMLLSMVVPPLLVLAAPVTLALRTLSARHDGTRGPREWVLAAVTSRPMRVLAFPPVAAVLFTGSLVVFYFTGLFRLALTTHTGHELMHLHFLLVGYLFAWVLIGVDPGPHRTAYPLRLVLLFATMAFHAFFGVALTSGTTVLQPQFFGELGRTWGGSLLDDQRLGGSLAWGIGEIPTLLFAIVVAVQWANSDGREARRTDRAADRDGDAELTAYNAMLERLAARQAPPTAR